MQSAFHNLNVYTPWLHISSQSTNTNKSIKTGYQPCLLCFAGVPRLSLSPPVLNCRHTQTSVCRRSPTVKTRNTIKKQTHIYTLEHRVHECIDTHADTHKENTIVLPIIASVPSSHSQRTTNTNQISTSHRCVPCLRYSN